MQKLSIYCAAAALLVATGAWAGEPTGRDWDDSHMRTRFAAPEKSKTRLPIIIGEATTSTEIPETLDAATLRSWSDNGQRVLFGKQAPRTLNGGGLSFSSTPSRGSGSGSGSGSLGRSGGRGIR